MSGERVDERHSMFRPNEQHVIGAGSEGFSAV
jgi:hypothetical protein